jgi:hypothetical protein
MQDKQMKKISTYLLWILVVDVLMVCLLFYLFAKSSEHTRILVEESTTQTRLLLEDAFNSYKPEIYED